MEIAAPRKIVASESASSRWQGLAPLRQAGRRHRDVADGNAAIRCTEGYDLLRTRIQPTCAEKGWTRIAIAQLNQGGHAAAATALNLALSEARLAHRHVVLVDLDARQQTVSGLLSAPAPAPATATDQAAPDRVLSAAEIGDRLALVRMSPVAATNPTATILAPPFRAELERVISQLDPDLVLFHAPPLLAGDTGLAALDLAQTLVIALGGGTDTAADVRLAEARIAGRCPLLGVFLFDAEG